MIIVYVCLVLLALQALLPGHDIRRLAAVRLRGTWLVWLALLVQVLIISVLPHVDLLSQAAHLASYGLAGAFAVVNRRLPGVLVVAAGGASNALAIAANNGTMPASQSALASSGWAPDPDHFANSAALADPHLAVLGDVFATPGWFPLQSIFSIGDVVIVVGFALVVHCSTRAGAESRSTDLDLVATEPAP